MSLQFVKLQSNAHIILTLKSHLFTVMKENLYLYLYMDSITDKIILPNSLKLFYLKSLNIQKEGILQKIELLF